MSQLVQPYVVATPQPVTPVSPWKLLADLVRADDGLLRALGTLPTYLPTAAEAHAKALAKAREALRAAGR